MVSKADRVDIGSLQWLRDAWPLSKIRTILHPAAARAVARRNSLRSTIGYWTSIIAALQLFPDRQANPRHLRRDRHNSFYLANAGLDSHGGPE